MNTTEMLVKALAGKRLSSEERIELSKGIISDKVEFLLMEQFLIAQHSIRGAINLTLSANQCSDSDSNIYKFLELLGCRKISISSDFGHDAKSHGRKTIVKYRI